MRQATIISICLCWIASLHITAQQVTHGKKDTILLRAGYILHYKDQQLYTDKDTLVLLDHGTRHYVAPVNTGSDEAFYEMLRQRASSSDWTSRLHNIIIRPPQKSIITDTIRTEKTGDQFIPYHNRRIRNIYYRKLEPFGPAINDTARKASSRLEQLANDMHVITQDQVLANHLLFSEGDPLDAYMAGDNERILRDLPFIQDARIIITNPGTSDSVDVYVLVKDAFPYGAGGSLSDIDAGKLELFHKNILGYGHQFHMLFHWNAEKSPWLGNEFIYRINNLSGSFINSKLRYAQVFETEIFEAELDRKFFTPNTKYAGAFNFMRTSTAHDIPLADTVLEDTPVSFDRTDLWVGRSFYLTPRSRYARRRMNLVVAGRYLNEFFRERPLVGDSTLYAYHHKDVLLFSLGISQQTFFRSNLIYSFGRTEDIPQGTLFNLTAGPEFSEFNTRWYAAAEISKGGYMGNYGYLLGSLGYGGYIENIDFVEQGVLDGELDYFSNLFIINRYKVRHFLNIRYTRGIRRLKDELLDINESNGIRGFRSDAYQGTHRLKLNYEVNTFTPYYLYGFRFVVFGFADFGLVGSDLAPIIENRLHSGIGVGLRIKNERLVFETVQIRLGYYPSIDDGQFPLVIDVAGEKRLNHRDFYVTKPDVIRFD